MVSASVVVASTVMRVSTVVAAVTPSGAPLCALLAIGCCERRAVRAEEEILEVAWTVAVSVVVASMAAVADAAAASMVVALAVVAVAQAVAAVATELGS